jgi:hypothetical protein
MFWKKVERNELDVVGGAFDKVVIGGSESSLDWRLCFYNGNPR